MHPDRVHLGQALPVLAATCISAVAGSALRPRDLPSVIYRPRNAAFSIWGVIYVALGVTAFQLLTQPTDAAAVALVVCSLLGTALWAALVQSWPRLAAAVLVAAAALSAAALPVGGPSIRRAADVCAYTGPALLAGWLVLAAALGIDVARQQSGKEATGSSYLPLHAAALLGAALTVGTRFFIVGLPLLWAAVWLPDGTPHRTVLIALAGAAIAASGAWGVAAR